MQKKYSQIPDESLIQKPAEIRLKVENEALSETDLSEKLIQNAFLINPNEG